jgi:hypothetical protein
VLGIGRGCRLGVEHHMLKSPNLLWLAVFKHLKVLLREIGHRPALAIQHPHIDRDERDAASERTGHLGLLCRHGRRKQREPGSYEHFHQSKL